MGLSMLEQETVVSWNRAEDEMTVYTADTFLIAKLRERAGYELIREDRQDDQVVAAVFRASKKLVTLRGQRPPMSAEDREKARERMRRLNTISQSE